MKVLVLAALMFVYSLARVTSAGYSDITPLTMARLLGWGQHDDKYSAEQYDHKGGYDSKGQEEQNGGKKFIFRKGEIAFSEGSGNFKFNKGEGDYFFDQFFDNLGGEDKHISYGAAAIHDDKGNLDTKGRFAADAEYKRYHRNRRGRTPRKRHYH